MDNQFHDQEHFYNMWLSQQQRFVQPSQTSTSSSSPQFSVTPEPAMSPSPPPLPAPNIPVPVPYEVPLPDYPSFPPEPPSQRRIGNSQLRPRWLGSGEPPLYPSGLEILWREVPNECKAIITPSDVPATARYRGYFTVCELLVLKRLLMARLTGVEVEKNLDYVALKRPGVIRNTRNVKIPEHTNL